MKYWAEDGRISEREMTTRIPGKNMFVVVATVDGGVDVGQDFSAAAPAAVRPAVRHPIARYIHRYSRRWQISRQRCSSVPARTGRASVRSSLQVR